ncbi:MAG: IS66 family insertion sequence element accessory protein TnpA [Acidiferrobacteraceae bacterium]
MGTTVSTPITHHKQHRRSASEWRALIRAFSQSSETRTQFCERHGVALSTFAWWRSRLRRESSARAVSNTMPSHPGALFVELAQAEPPVATVSARWDVELELGRGVFLRLRRGAC